MNSKERTQALYDQFIALMDEVHGQINSLQGKSKEYNILQRSYLETLSRQGSEARVRMHETMKETEWDRLVIAFFGETNAGKSTLIDTFRVVFDEPERRQIIEQNGGKPVDGVIIGDGRADFTRVYHEYKMMVNGRPFTLIDVPGIEGHEDEQIKEEIQLALKKAHVVFYVCNQKPDTATAEKITQYLSQWVNVYAIYNIRGGVSNYDEDEERETLLTEQILRNMTLIDDGFKNTLPSVYKGIYPVQALLANCAIADFSEEREDLRKKQKKLIQYFGDSDSLYNFSGFPHLINLIDEKSQNYLDEVDKANEQKIASLYRHSMQEMQDVIELNRKRVNLLEKALERFRSRINLSFQDAQRSLVREVDMVVEKHFDDYYDKVCIIINTTFEYGIGRKREKLISVSETQLQDHLQEDIPTAINRIVTRLQERIEKDSRELQELYTTPIQMAQGLQCIPTVKMDMKQSLGQLNLSKKDYRDLLLHVGGMASVGFQIGFMFPVIGNVAGTLLGAIVGLIHDIALRYRKQGSTRGKAKDHARREMLSAMQKCRDEHVHPALQQIQDLLEEQHHLLITNIQEEQENMENMHSLLSDTQQHLIHNENNIWGRLKNAPSV